MNAVLWPALYVLALWWLSTGLILLLVRLPPRTFPTTMAWAGVVLAAALWGLVHTRTDTGPTGAWCAFSCALLVWAWQELAFLLGIVTGPRRTACPPGVQGWARARLALATLAHHELALVALAVAVWLAVGDGANRVGWWTYVALWAMRQSAKLNLFLGARNHSEAFLPAHLKYLHSYFRRAPANPLLPVSLAAMAAAGGWVLQQWPLATASGADTAGLALLGTLLALGALEHLMLVAPMPPELLWRWSLPARGEPPVAGSPTGRALTPPP